MQCLAMQRNAMQKRVQCTGTAHLAETGGAEQHSPGAGGGAARNPAAMQPRNNVQFAM